MVLWLSSDLKVGVLDWSCHRVVSLDTKLRFSLSTQVYKWVINNLELLKSPKGSVVILS